MLKIVRGYKKGRAVLFYDIFDDIKNKTVEKVAKEQVVNAIQSGSIGNAKVQFWQGKAIVRVSNEIQLLQLDENGNILGEAKKTVRGQNKPDTTVSGRVQSSSNNDKQPEIKYEIVGKVKNKKPKRNTTYVGYDYSNVTEKISLENSSKIKSCTTVSDLFDMMASDFNLKNTEQYKREVGKKIELEEKLSSMSPNWLNSVRGSLATYLLNMAYEELSEVYMKYSVR